MRNDNTSLCRWLLAYALSYALFHILPAFLQGSLAWPVNQGDALDFLTPLVVIPTALAASMTLKRLSEARAPSLGKRSDKIPWAVLILGFLLYVDGHGIHLSANSIARLLEGQEGSRLFRGVYLYDEVISHFMWDGGVFLISVGLLLLARRASFGRLTTAQSALVSAAAAFYGFAYAVNSIEGQTVVLMFPAAGAAFVWCLGLYLRDRKRNAQDPVVFFFLCGYLLSVILLAYWGIKNSGFPEFSDLGWI
ncbi:MAG: hypothetical protein QME85_05085 [Candidatus Saccharicenans sp.]|nr:hypothetical protein [Candidatus Saccharicenans sp.]